MISYFTNDHGEVGKVDCLSRPRAACSFPHCNCPVNATTPQAMVPLSATPPECVAKLKQGE